MMIGIDLGTTFSLAAYYQDGAAKLIPNALGKVLTPSVVHFKEDLTFIVGECSHPDYLYHAKYFKEYMGTNHSFQMGKLEFSPIELSSFVLKQLKDDAERHLGCEITEAVISVPAYFNDNQRIATKQAGQLAGLNTATIINEPSAAALAHRFDKEENTVMVFDFGGGTLDISIVDCFENIIEILSISGDNHLGGKTIDNLLVTGFCNATGMDFNAMEAAEQEEFLLQIEQLKMALAKGDTLFTYKDYSQYFTPLVFQNMIQPVFERMKDIMKEAVKNCRKKLGDIDEVILVGGSSNLMGLAEFIEEKTGLVPLLLGNPQEVVAKGMGYYTGIKTRDKNVCDLVLTDVCPFTLGVGVVHSEHDKAPHVKPMIPRNSTLPATHTESFSPVYEDQTAINLSILQGEAYYKKDNLILGDITIDLDEGSIQDQTIDVSFTYDINGILQVDVLHVHSGRKKSRIIANQSLQYNDYELKKATEALNRFKLATEQHPLLQKALKLYETSNKHTRAELDKAIAFFQQAMRTGLVEQRKAEYSLSMFIDQVIDHQNDENLLYSDFDHDDFEDDYSDDED